MSEAKAKVGRPPRFKNAQEMQSKIDAYFEKCEKKDRPPTITGLALALGFRTRQALLLYEAKSEFVDTVSRAKSMVEMYAEERLFDREGVQGAKFSLQNNFEGWSEKPLINASVKGDVVIDVELSDDD